MKQMKILGIKVTGFRFLQDDFTMKSLSFLRMSIFLHPLQLLAKILLEKAPF